METVKELAKEYMKLEHERWDLLDQLEEIKKGVIRPKLKSKPHKEQLPWKKKGPWYPLSLY